jgi:citrate lyase subunit beta/citryl-CoA lyase
MKPLRTALFAPGNRPDRVEKALKLNADAVIIDLEDAVPIAQKESTRGLIKEILDANPGKRIYVRINALTTPYAKEDIAALGSVNLAGVMLPKVDSPEDLILFDKLLSHLEKDSSLAPGSLEVISICETAKGLDQISQILNAKTERKRDTVVAFGAADYTLDLGINLTREGRELDFARTRLPIASRAAGIAPPIDTPWMVDLKDIEGLIADAKKAKSLGFQGKLVIHPNQIEPCHDVFTPTEEEIAHAKKIVEAFKAAETEGQAAIQIDGKFIDYPVVEKSRRIIELTKIIRGQE